LRTIIVAFEEAEDELEVARKSTLISARDELMAEREEQQLSRLPELSSNLLLV
jgi:hypothetical protein